MTSTSNPCPWIPIIMRFYYFPTPRMHLKTWTAWALIFLQMHQSHFLVPCNAKNAILMLSTSAPMKFHALHWELPMDFCCRENLCPSWELQMAIRLSDGTWDGWPLMHHHALIPQYHHPPSRISLVFSLKRAQRRRLSDFLPHYLCCRTPNYLFALYYL